MQTVPYSILLIGCGKMGAAMLSAWLQNDLTSRVTIADPGSPPQIILSDARISHVQSLNDLEDNSDFDIAVLAIKPQILDHIADDLKRVLSADTALLSIAAGKTIDSFESILGNAQPVLRCMPNTPAAIGKGVSAVCGNTSAQEHHKTCAQTLLEACGSVEWIENENLFNAITALSGSGPAYIFYLIEVLSKAGIDIGLPENLATNLARQTVIGAAALAEHDAETPANTLRKNVTSPGGTTAAALDVLMNGEVQNFYTRALQNAKTRGEELNE